MTWGPLLNCNILFTSILYKPHCKISLLSTPPPTRMILKVIATWFTGRKRSICTRSGRAIASTVEQICLMGRGREVFRPGSVRGHGWHQGWMGAWWGKWHVCKYTRSQTHRFRKRFQILRSSHFPRMTDWLANETFKDFFHSGFYYREMAAGNISHAFVGFKKL